MQNPPWPATYNMSLSTITMACNSSGWYNATLGAQFGIVSYDWSNEKSDWANSKPMDCEERLVTQATMTKKINPNAKVFSYRNIVKALPWFTSIRTKLDDPAYSGFFLKFKPGGFFPNGSYHVPACTGKKCSIFYHDQEQTPQVPTPEHPHPDGVCIKECDCGKKPCGEYLFDHRNGSMLTDFLIKEHILGPNGVGNVNIDGLFIDDFWCSNLINKTCDDPVQGPTEIDKYSQLDMGLSDQDILDLTQGWLANMEAVQKAIIEHGGYTWSLIPGQQNANAAPKKINQTTCVKELRKGCSATSPYRALPLIFGIEPGTKDHRLPYFKQNLATFLLIRGPYAYLGYGVWGMSWPANELPTRPPELELDYGEPRELCRETAKDSQIFTREWSKASVQINCKTWEAIIKMKG